MCRHEHVVSCTGVKAAGHAAFVLVAGGLGERLGYSGIKLALPVESASNKCFLQVSVPTCMNVQATAMQASDMRHLPEQNGC